MNENFFGPLCAFLSSVTWAIATSTYFRLARDYSPFSVNLARCSVALPLFLVWALVSAGLSSGSWLGVLHAFQAVELRHLAWFTLSMGASYAFGDSCFLLSSRTIGVPAALAIASSYPLLTASSGFLFQGQLLAPLQILGLLVTVGGLGAVIISAPVGSGGRLVTTTAVGSKVKGVALAIVAAFCWAVNSYAVMEGGQGISTAVGNTVRMLIALILCVVSASLLAPKGKIVLPLREYRKWLWVFVAESFLGSFFFLYGLAHSSLAVGSTLSAVSPVLAVPVSLAMGLESFCWKRTVSVVTVVFGIFLLVGGA